MKRPIATLCAAFGLIVALAAAAPAGASNEIAKAEGVACTVCHDKPGSKLLTDRGKYYEALGTLEGFDELTGAFGACTTCHVKKPGSAKLTRQGRRISLVLQDMAELRAWLMEQHPAVEEGAGEPSVEGGGGEAPAADAAPASEAGEEREGGGPGPALLPAHRPLG